MVFGDIELCRLALGSMRARRNGRIINVTSLASRLPLPFMGAYNAARAAMASFTMTLQLELENSGIRVIDVQPGDIRTDFNDALIKNGRSDRQSSLDVERAWQVIDRNMRTAPSLELVAGRLAKLSTTGRLHVSPWAIRFRPSLRRFSSVFCRNAFASGA